MSSNGLQAGEILRATQLAPRLLVLLTRVDPSVTSPEQRMLVCESGPEPARISARWFKAATDQSDQAGTWLFTAAVPPALDEIPGELSLSSGDRSRPLLPRSLGGVLCTPAEFAEFCKSTLAPGVAGRVPSFLAQAPASHQVELTDGLAAGLNAIRDVLRRQLPGTVLAPGPLVARLEAVTRLDDRGFWLTGLIHDAAPSEVNLTAITPEGARRELPPGAVTFHPRPAYSEGLADDEAVSTLGFQAFVELESPSRHPSGWVVEFHTAGGEAVEDVDRTVVSDDPGEIRSHVRSQMRGDTMDEATLERQVLPVLTRLRDAADQPAIQGVTDFGPVPEQADVSLVIAVRRLDRIQHQLVEFARDPQISRTEVVFVAAAPRQGELDELGGELYELYGVPFRVVELTRRARMPRALNLGTTAARGRQLILMSGDVFPANPGWIEAMAALGERSASVAAVGAKLLREDNSIAHAGTEYAYRAHPRELRRISSFAGLARSLPAANVAKRVTAGSEACMMVPAERFRAAGGFLELYADGDEAGDLCLRLGDAGGETWYCPEAELYLLDRSEQPQKTSRAQTLFNDWLFRHRWEGRLGVKDRQRAPVPPAAPVAPAATSVAPAAAPAAAVPPAASWATASSGDPIEQLEVIQADLADDAVVAAAMVRSPRAEDQSAFATTYTLWVDGWAVARDAQPLTIELRAGGRLLRTMVAELPAPKVPPRYEDLPRREKCGFSIALGSFGLPLEFELTVDARSSSGASTTIGRVVGRRRPLRSGYSPAIQPLLVTQLGRSGSSWMVTLLSSHPEIVALHPLRFEAKQALYWSSVLSTLVQPTSYMKGLNSGPFADNWWVGDGAAMPPRPRVPEPAMPRWLGSQNIEVLTGMCQSRVDDFYAEVGRLDGKPDPRYFVEKSDPIDGPSLIAEIWPDGREILLVRDFRDWVCSIVGYNTKRGMKLWLRDQTDDDVEWFGQLRGSAERLLQAWRERGQQAHLVRYEDLVTHPDSTLTAICSYLGVDGSAETIAKTLASAQGTVPEAQKAHTTSSSVADSVGRWRTDLTAEQLAACAEAFDDILVEFGYEPTPLAPASEAESQPAAP